MNKSFLSIVEFRGDKKKLLIRARAKGDIERMFKTAEVEEGKGTDYQYRALVLREVVAAAINRELDQINYGNFKDSVKEKWRHDAYMSVWHTIWKSFQGR